MNNFEFEHALNQIIKDESARGDKNTVVWAQVIQSGWRRCNTGTQKRAFRREAERLLNKHLVPVKQVANDLAPADGSETNPATSDESTE